ncbi:unnamed protein product [Linum trigynum]|uniref:Uncharacterized protein n=1 Tax=Linum trigynum TaxID=586398 RepID=A0AAV2D827_9ROSI
MCMDHSLSQRRKIGAVKVCVEVSAQKPFVDRISITPDDMEEMYIGVEYCGLPKCCSACGVFGHDCSKPAMGVTTKQVWRPKRQITSRQDVSPQIVAEVESGKERVIVEKAGEIVDESAQGKEGVQEGVLDENVGGSSKKGKEVIVDSTPPVTPSALPSQEEFNKVINGAKSRSLPKEICSYTEFKCF